MIALMATSTLLLSLAAAPWPAGQFRLDVIVVVAAEVPVLGTQTTTTTSISVVDVDDQGNAVARGCVVETSGPGFRSFMPPSTLRKLPPARFAFVVDGNKVEADLGEGRVGYTGEGPIPSKASDPRVIDLDGDGLPGTRMMLDVGPFGRWTLQVISRGHTVLAGTVDDKGGAGGTPKKLDSEERVLSGLPMGPPERKEAIDPARSRWSLTPVVDGDLSFCRW